ncbi:dihydrofolate reductase [Schaalia sp. 19OD2882]|nr:dihydrofolate reductase [Schaalia sp. 19OD2882]
MRLASIWAQDRGRVLGSGTGMLWHVPADFAHFKAATMGCPILMGRASWEALGRALPGRLNVVLTGDAGYRAEGAVVVHSLEQGVDLCRHWAGRRGADTVWVTGGATVYEQAMGLVDELVVTDLDLDVAKVLPEGAPLVRAPHIDPRMWRVDAEHSDAQWRQCSGDARWRVTHWVRA